MISKMSDNSLYEQILVFTYPFLTSQEASKTSKNKIYSTLLESFVHINLSEEEAKEHWKYILENATMLEKKLKKKIPPQLAIVDYFLSEGNYLQSPYLVEIQVFQKAEQLAMIDPLTGVFNRRYLEIALQKEINRSNRYKKQFSVAIFDIDDFKKINDTYGHLIGDEILQTFTAHVKDIIREEDILCRYGGEEFLIILPETDASRAINLCNRIRTSFKEKKLIKHGAFSFSAGIASFPNCGKDPAILIQQADKALYKAKYSGKDCCVLAKHDHTEQSEGSDDKTPTVKKA